MKDGIYFVVFKSNSQDFGTGTVVVRDGTVNGGDFGYSYKGKIQNDSITLSIEKHNPQVTSVFGDINRFQLELNVGATHHGYMLKGGVNGLVGTEIVIDAKCIGDLAV